MQKCGIFRVAVFGVILLLTAAFAAHACAQDRIDPQELKRAAWFAAQKWEGAVRPALSWGAQSRVRWHDIDRAWGSGMLALVAADLLAANPGRKDDVLVYLNDVLLPAMHELRSDYICGYTRWYYGHTVLMHYISMGEDPYLAVAYFTAPTRGYLREHNLTFAARAQRYLEKYARFSPDGSKWQAMMAARSHIPCDSEVDVNRKSLRVRP